MVENGARRERGGAEQPAPQPESGADPLDAALEQARYNSAGSSLPSERGLGPGAGETPVASVSAGSLTEEEDVPSNPSTGSPPREGGAQPEPETSTTE